MGQPRYGALGGLDLDAMLRQAREAEARLAEMNARRDEMRIVGHGGDDLVEATVDGTGRVVDLRIEARAMRMDSHGLAEAMLAAITAAYAEYDEQAQALLGEATGDPELFAKIRDGSFDPYEYLRGFGLNMPEIRGMVQ
jgi:DNA-binding protein YbaB